jgi:hypothetical protein
MERVNANIWERMLYGPVWFTLFIIGWVLAEGGGLGAILVLSILVISFFLVSDRWSCSRLGLAVVYIGDHQLLIDGKPVAIEDIVWLREIWYEQVVWTIIEIVYRKDGEEVKALCAGKPSSPFSDDNKTVALIVGRFPVLRARVAFPYLTHRKKRVLRAPRPELEDDKEQVHRNISPMARYRDPYFRRKRK